MSGTVVASPASSFAAGPPSDTEKMDLRRLCGYPLYGSYPGGSFAANRILEIWFANMAPAEQQEARRRLAELYGLEAALVAAGDNLATDRAAAWTHNKQEVGDRAGLFDRRRRALCAFFGVEPGPGLGMGGRLVRT